MVVDNRAFLFILFLLNVPYPTFQSRHLFRRTGDKTRSSCWCVTWLKITSKTARAAMISKRPLTALSYRRFAYFRTPFFQSLQCRFKRVSSVEFSWLLLRVKQLSPHLWYARKKSTVRRFVSSGDVVWWRCLWNSLPALCRHF